MVNERGAESRREAERVLRGLGYHQPLLIPEYIFSRGMICENNVIVVCVVSTETWDGNIVEL
jgi:hypothetical protein